MIEDVQHPSEQAADPDQATFPAAPTIHNVRIAIQVDDNNQLYESLRQLAGPRTSSDGPKIVSPHTPSWAYRDNPVRLGLFSSPTGLWDSRNEEHRRIEDVHLRHYSSEPIDTDAPNAGYLARTKLVIEPRHASIESSPGTPYHRYQGVESGNPHIGSLIKINTSYVADPGEALSRAKEMLRVVLGNKLDTYFNPIHETARFKDIELYLRHHRRTMEPMVQTLKSSAALAIHGSDADVDFGGYARGGQLSSYTLETSELRQLGFELPAPREVTNQHVTARIKCYLPESVDSVDIPYMQHPKTEIEINARYPKDRWDEAIRVGRDVLCSHADWAGIDDQQLIPDEWFELNPCEYRNPNTRREQLEQYYQSQALRRSLEARLFASRTTLYRDILTFICYDDDPASLTYDQLAEKTGAARRTIRKRVSELCELGILYRDTHDQTYITWRCKQAKERVQKIFRRTTETVGDLLEQAKERSKRR